MISKWYCVALVALVAAAANASVGFACSVCGCCRPNPDDPVSQYLYGDTPPIYDGSYEVGQQAPAPGGTGSAVIPIEPGSWSLVLMPDTQHYSENVNGNRLIHFTNQTQWIKDNAAALNIKYVLHEGDIVNTAASLPQWNNARAALDTLNGFVPYGLAPGNHDYGGQGANRTTFFDHQATDADTNNYFGVGTPYASQPSIGGFYPHDGPGKTDNSYHTWSANGEDWIAFALEWGLRDSVVLWADQVLSSPAYANHNAILVTHAYMYYDDTIYDWATKNNSQSWNPHEYGIQTWVDPITGAPASVNDGQELWDEFVKKHENFKFVFNGHVLSDGAGQRSTLGNNGNVVHQILANYQMNAEGGQGDMRVLEFKADGETVVVRTYSPSLDRYNTAPNQQFTLNMNQIPEPPAPVGHAIVGNLVATGVTDPSSNTFNTVTVPQSSAPGVGTGQLNRGDFQPTFGGSTQTFTKGILLATISQHSRPDFMYDATHFRRAVVDVGRTPYGDGNLSLSIMEAGSAPASGAGTQNEVNFNTSVAWFDFASGFRGAHVNGGTGILPTGGFNGVSQSMVTKTTTGRYGVNLGVHSQNDGMLFTTGNTNNNLVVQTSPAANGSNWDVRVQLASANFAGTGTDTVPTASGSDTAAHWSFLYLDYRTPGLIGGYFDGFTGTNIKSAGNFTMTRTATGQYQLTVPGETPTSGMLLLTVAHQTTITGTTAPDDNILTYDVGAGGTFTINSYDLPDLGVSPYGVQDTKFVWAFISFANPIEPYVIPGDYNRDAKVDGFDYQVWRSQFGKSSGWMPADGNGDGRVDAADYVLWRKHLPPGGSGAITEGAVPEPAGAALVGGIVMFGLSLARFRQPGVSRILK